GLHAWGGGGEYCGRANHYGGRGHAGKHYHGGQGRNPQSPAHRAGGGVSREMADVLEDKLGRTHWRLEGSGEGSRCLDCNVNAGAWRDSERTDLCNGG